MARPGETMDVVSATSKVHSLTMMRIILASRVSGLFSSALSFEPVCRGSRTLGTHRVGRCNSIIQDVLDISVR